MPFEICDIDQRQPNRFALRLRAIGGQFTAEQLRVIADIAERYGKGEIHLTTRQGIEIHHVHHHDLEAAHKVLEKHDITMGARGPRVRIIIACPGEAACRYGAIDTRAIAAELARRYLRMEMPPKVKMGVTGCRHNCGKAREADIGVMGSLEPPEWIEDKCLPRINRAFINKLMGNYELALSDYETILKLDPDNAKAKEAKEKTLKAIAEGKEPQIREEPPPE